MEVGATPAVAIAGPGAASTSVAVAASSAALQTTGGRFAVDLFVGGISAAVSKTAVAPMERVKLLLQVQNSHSGIAVDRRYKGIIDCFLRVPREQGFVSLWRGNLTNVVRSFPAHALNFAFNDFYKSIFVRDIDQTKEFWRYTLWSLAAGGCAGATTNFVVYPLDLVRTRLSVDVGKKNTRLYKGFMDCTRKTIRHEGFFALYRGFSISFQTYFIYRAMYFGLYDMVRCMLEKDGKPLSFGASFAVAQGVSMCSAMITYPWDTVRRRIIVRHQNRSDGVVAKPEPFGHAYRVCKEIVTKEGVRGLFRGALANVFRTAGGALVMAIYEEIHKHL